MKKSDIDKRKYTTITIPNSLFLKLEDKIKNTGFSSVSSYITFLLREILMEMGSKKRGKKANEDVIEKLKSLGYA
ncbi:MAG: CopG family transcriptional regulator [Candidatus Micrarchaeales archaeon]|jgi:Arc/MetJ-type ribon-helix-helix transcriptional regulator